MDGCHSIRFVLGGAELTNRLRLAKSFSSSFRHQSVFRVPQYCTPSVQEASSFIHLTLCCGKNDLAEVFEPDFSCNTFRLCPSWNSWHFYWTDLKSYRTSSGPSCLGVSQCNSCTGLFGKYAPKTRTRGGFLEMYIISCLREAFVQPCYPSHDFSLATNLHVYLPMLK